MNLILDIIGIILGLMWGVCMMLIIRKNQKLREMNKTLVEHNKEFVRIWKHMTVGLDEKDEVTITIKKEQK